jgi:hypothetical protein
VNQRIRVLQGLGEQIERTVTTEATHRQRPRRVQSRAGGLATVLAATAALGIALVAIVLLAGRHSSPPVTGGAAGVNPTIISEFAAFRRPRTAADAVPKNLEFNCGPVAGVHGMFCFIDQRQELTSPRSASVTALRAQLQLGQSRRFTLPGGLGTVWLIPAGDQLCGLVRIPSLYSFRPFPGTMMCERASRVLAHPPLTWPGYFFALDNAPYPHHGYLIGIEPDRIARATITYPGGREATILRQGLLLGCVGMGPYHLVQTTTSGDVLASIRVGGVGAFRPVSCPQFHQAAGIQPATRR